ncbi:MAG: efflux RND transporter periplasmic adaptor subunit [Acidobacteriota bacterium]|nr:efflux RND transporter periplasmic adaptor subunit [Acidobacteriota bacterium]
MSQILIRLLKGLLPVVVVGLAVGAAYLMYVNRPPVETQAPVIEPPSVRVQTVAFEQIALTVASQGTVQPRTTSQLVPEIAGAIIEVSPSFAVGGFFDAGDVLLKIDPYDYQQALISGRSQLAQAQLRLAQEEAEAEVARREWEEIGQGTPSPLTLRQPQVDEARAAVASAEAAIDRATRDLERAEVRAPYAGRVQSKEVDVGQFVNKGTTVGQIYAVDSAEIRLPLPDEELAYVDVPLSYRGGQQQTGPLVTLSADFAGRQHTWRGRIVRTESEIDPVSRMVHVVAEVNDPYAVGDDRSRPPLAAGMFVEAEIAGLTVTDVVRLPWAALRGRNRVLVVDDQGRLRFRQVEVLRSTSEQVLVRAGLDEGERVCISALDTVTDGMVVRVIDDDVRMADAAATAPTSATDVPPSSDPATMPEPVTTEISAVEPTPPTANSDRPDDESTPLTPPSGDTRRGARRSPDQRFELDETLSPAEQIAAIRREIERVQASQTASAPAPAPRAGVTPAPTAPTASTPTAPPTPRANQEAQGNVTSVPNPADRATRPPTSTEMAAKLAAGIPLNLRARTTNADATLPPAPSHSEPALALLPFTNLSRNPADDAIGVEMAAVVRAELERTGGLGVVPLTLADGPDALEAASARQAQWLVGGGYQRVGEQLRLTARMLDVESGQLLSSVKLDGTLSGRDALTDDLIATLRTELGTAEVAPARSAADVVSAPAVLRIAVSPFSNISRNPDDDRLSSEVAEMIAGAFQDLPSMNATTLADGDNAEPAALAAAAARDAGWLVSGGFQHVGPQLRITARLLDVTSGTFVESAKVDGSVAELPQLLKEVVATFSAALASPDASL